MGGDMGSEVLKPVALALQPTWVAGSAVDVAWGMRYNHGGGYQYRLCPADEPLTEECFQRHPLEFDRTKQVLKWNNGSLEYPMGSKAVFVDGDAVRPKGSTWARNPIPRIWDSKAGYVSFYGSLRGHNNSMFSVCFRQIPPDTVQ